MTVEELAREFQLGTKYAVEVDYYKEDEFGNTPTEEWETYHYTEGESVRNPFYKETVQNIRVVANEIYVRVYVRLSET